jgi:hypothetical protein
LKTYYLERPILTGRRHQESVSAERACRGNRLESTLLRLALDQVLAPATVRLRHPDSHRAVVRRSEELLFDFWMPTAGSQAANVALVGSHVDDVRIALDTLEQLVAIAIQNLGLKTVIRFFTYFTTSILTRYLKFKTKFSKKKPPNLTGCKSILIKCSRLTTIEVKQPDYLLYYGLDKR